MALGVLLAAGAAVRFPGLREPIVSFHPLRHYRSALIARACYYEATPSTPAWALAIARANRDIQQAGEPPVMEWMACAAYRALGREELAVPRMLSSLWWLVGGIATYLLGRRTISVHGGLLAATLYLFLPYSILATRTFQPDPLMTASTAWALLCLVWWTHQPDRRRLITAAMLAGVALFVKPMSVFIVFPAIVVAVRSRPDPASGGRSRDTVLLIGLALILPGLFYGNSLLFGRLAQDQMQTRFVPSLIVTGFFWKGLARQIHTVYGWVPALAAVIGTFLASDTLLRRLLVAAWLGYATFAVVFTYHMPTHDYYHLPFVPIAALAAAAGVERVWSALRLRSTTAFAATCALCSFVAWQGAVAAAPRLHRPDAAALVADYQRIGEVTHHDPQIVFLDLEYGYPLMYHAEVAGDAWPGSDDLEAERLDGRPPRSASDRLTEDYAKPHYFVVTDLSSLDAQADLQAVLSARATLIDETPLHRVYRVSEPTAHSTSHP